MPLRPMYILEKLQLSTPATPLPPCTPLNESPLDLLFLNSSPPDGTELHQANIALNSALRTAENLPSPARKYTERMTNAYERTSSELVLARKQLKEAHELLRTRKITKKGKRIALKGKFVFSTEEALKLVEAAEAETAVKKAKKNQQHRTDEDKENRQKEEMFEILSDSSESDCIVVS